MGFLLLLGIGLVIGGIALLAQGGAKSVSAKEKEELEKELANLKNDRQKLDTQAEQIINNCVRKQTAELREQYEEKQQIITELQERLRKRIIEAKEKEEELSKKAAQIEFEKAYYDKAIQDFNKMIEQKCAYYPELAVIVADLLTVHYARSADFLENKPRPAYKEAERIRELRKETKVILAEKKEMEYKLNYIYSLFPTIDEVFDDGFNMNVFEREEEDNDYDRTSLYLTKEEYDSLSSAEKNQLALDRYCEAGGKSKWQIGRDYEMYIGHLYEQKGYNVEYNGIRMQLEDLGRDIIATKDSEILIIQCKNWSQKKTIHEKHIFQLYGTVVHYKVTHNDAADVKGIFITTTKLSDTAKLIADYLGITVSEETPLGAFPRIKCNINHTTGEKIYHLPFDQQYDNVVIEKERGEMWSTTVKEAENAGFRRAFRHIHQ